MIIILGPDASGKTTLAKEFALPHYHFDRSNSYADYLGPLSQLRMFDAILDRHILCEYPYSTVMRRKFAFTGKEWHNIVLLTLIQNPVIILCTHKPPFSEYSRTQYLPYEKWDECLSAYRRLLNTHHIKHVEYDYAQGTKPSVFSIIEAKYRSQVSWWRLMWEAGYGAIGSPYPKVLIVAERLGPNNMNNLPFETGPTGYMLSDMLASTGTPLGKVAVTNLVKSFRRDPRPPNSNDLALLHVELEHLRPEKVVFMGSVAKQGAKVAKELGIECVEIPHLGYYHHKGITDMSGYHANWRQIMEMVPSLTLKGGT